ncbi:MAG: cation transporter [Deltaproteobacteria bacterium]|nr:cation transporter [Deltaproteobacteria bacterium]
MASPDDPTRRKQRAAALSVASNATLVACKLAVGLAIGSVSVVSEAVHSAMDLVAAAIAWIAVRTSSRPADTHHRFGHGKIENVSGAIEAFLILAAAVWIGFEAVDRLRHPSPVDAPLAGVLVMGLSVAANVGVSRHLFRVGRETESMALLADAWHLRTDVWTAGGVLVALAAVTLGRRLLPGVDLSWVDPVAAIAVALLIAHAAWKLTSEAVGDLLDRSLPGEEEAWIRAQVEAHRPVVRSFHALRTRRSGPHRFVDFHLVLDPATTVEAAHTLVHALESTLQARFPGVDVMIHVEPCDGSCSENCRSGCDQAEQPGAVSHRR